MESQASSVADAEPQLTRLVIRVKLVSEPPPRVSIWQRVSSGAWLLILVAVAALLGWVGLSIFKAEPTSAPAPIQAAPSVEPQPPPAVPARSETAPVVGDEPLPQSAAETAETKVINEVIPDVPRSARETIRGTIRVSVRVIVDQKGTVLSATAEERGPSRYFERLALAAAKQWTFTPAASPAQRSVLVSFSFTRARTLAASSPATAVP